MVVQVGDVVDGRGDVADGDLLCAAPAAPAAEPAAESSSGRRAGGPQAAEGAELVRRVGGVVEGGIVGPLAGDCGRDRVGGGGDGGGGGLVAGRGNVQRRERQRRRRGNVRF